jgi:1,5-anhydro-D-fructose reductase (1,5-anhydro-D-mannitol-forming)
VREAPDARLAAVCSRDLDKARSFSTRHGNPTAYSDIERLLENPDVDVVYIATPNAHHAAQTITALEAGRHVLVEKPMALTVDDARAMVATAHRRRLILGVGFHLRFHPVHIEMRNMIANGEIGQPTYVEGLFGSVANIAPGRWQLDPALAGHGSITGLGVHLVDLLPWLVGRPIVEVAALSDGPNDHRPVESLTTALLRFDNGSLGVITSSRRLPNARNSVRIYGTGGLVEGDGTIGVDPTGVLRLTNGSTTTTRAPELEDLYRLEVQAFARAIETDEPFGPIGEDGVTSVALTSAIAAAASAGKSVVL